MMPRSSWLKPPTRCSARSTWLPCRQQSIQSSASPSETMATEPSSTPEDASPTQTSSKLTLFRIRHKTGPTDQDSSYRRILRWLTDGEVLSMEWDETWLATSPNSSVTSRCLCQGTPLLQTSAEKDAGSSMPRWITCTSEVLILQINRHTNSR